MIPEGLTIALWTPSGSIFVGFLFLVFDNDSKGLDHRPLDSFGQHLLGDIFVLDDVSSQRA